MKCTNLDICNATGVSFRVLGVCKVNKHKVKILLFDVGKD